MTVKNENACTGVAWSISFHRIEMHKLRRLVAKISVSTKIAIQSRSKLPRKEA